MCQEELQENTILALRRLLSRELSFVKRNLAYQLFLILISLDEVSSAAALSGVNIEDT